MTSSFRVLPYHPASKSAKALAQALGAKRLKLQNSKVTSEGKYVVLNWGNTEQAHRATYNNYKPDLEVATNKLKFFLAMNESEFNLTPKFWLNKESIPDEEYPIVCRTLLTGHSGVGIVIADQPSDLVPSPLYVKYVKKKEEYRVHVGQIGHKTKTIGVRRKARDKSNPNPNWQVRNHDNGFIFQAHGFDVPEEVVEKAHQALTVSCLDYGAVDVIWNELEQKAYVLEINTAPGLEGQTIEEYVSFFKELAEFDALYG